jgi:hypothetical protein
MARIAARGALSRPMIAHPETVTLAALATATGSRYTRRRATLHRWELCAMSKDRKGHSARSPRRSGITVIVRRSDEPIDFDAWCAAYVRDLIAADRAKQREQPSPETET